MGIKKYGNFKSGKTQPFFSQDGIVWKDSSGNIVDLLKINNDGPTGIGAAWLLFLEMVLFISLFCSSFKWIIFGY